MKECDLLESAKDLAVKRGLDPTKVNCPITVCDGRSCGLIVRDREMTETIWRIKNIKINTNDH